MNFLQKYGPWALVAGASEGLGAAWANALGKRGLKLILLARRETALAETADGIRTQHGVEVVTVAADLASPDFVQVLAPVLQSREVGLYVHNAGYSPGGDFLSRPVTDQLRGVDVNCRAPVLLTSLLAPGMSARRRGGIILMSSLTAFQGTPHISVYGATKAFNLVLAEGLHGELAPHGVDVLACCAGATRTRSYLEAAVERAPGELGPEQVVEEALARLGRGAFMIPGRFNRFASLLMRRLMPRSQSVGILEKRTAKLKALP